MVLKVVIDPDQDQPRVFEHKDRVYPVWEPTYKEVLDKGFVGVVDFMGDDSSIAQSARTSYAKGTKKVRSDTGLIRYLLRHDHTTPFEMCEVKFHIKCPIFVARQWHRHRTASINEQSGRYSELLDEFHYPSSEDIMPQSKTNNQGRHGEISEHDKTAILEVMKDIFTQSYEAYEYLLGNAASPHTGYELNRLNAVEHVMSAMREKKSPITEEEIDEVVKKFSPPVIDQASNYPGLSRELAREVLPLSLYTQFYWKSNLLNIFRFLRLRMDDHAQKEIRVYAVAMYEMICKLFPVSCEAFDDYWLKSVRFSKMELDALLKTREKWINQALESFKKNPKVSQREIIEFEKKLTQS